jgi:hypothetical protein
MMRSLPEQGRSMNTPNTAASLAPRASRAPALLFAAALLTTLPVLAWKAVPVLTGASWANHGEHWTLLYVHVLGGLAMLGLGAAALYVGWTSRRFRWHRALGQAYLVLGGLGAAAALVLSIRAPHEPRSLYIATGTLAAVWLAVAAMAWRAARNRRFDSHREWVLRSYVLTWTFVGCRLAGKVPLFEGLGAEAVTAMIWMNWIVPLVVCELALQWRRGERAGDSVGDARGG